MNPIRGEWTWERTTRVGFRNPLGQVVVRKTDDYGDRPFQRSSQIQSAPYRCANIPRSVGKLK